MQTSTGYQVLSAMNEVPSKAIILPHQATSSLPTQGMELIMADQLFYCQTISLHFGARNSALTKLNERSARRKVVFR